MHERRRLRKRGSDLRLTGLRHVRGGGPAKGLCTTPCEVGSEADCERFGAGSICVNYGTEQAPSRFCAEGCTFGGGTSADPNKCHGRREVACAPLTNTQGTVLPTCVPQCNTNDDCGTNLLCDQRSGLCSTTSRMGDPVGAKCQDPGADGSADTCRGSCTGIVVTSGSPPVTFRCSERCTWGVVPSCGWSPGVGKADAYCLFFSTSIPDVGFGDRGSCGQLCDCDGDCRSPDLIFTALSGALRQSTGRQGFCTIPQTPTAAGVRRCPAKAAEPEALRAVRTTPAPTETARERRGDAVTPR